MIRLGIPQANSITSTPRCTDARASASVLPCSRVTRSRELFRVRQEQLAEPEHHPHPFDDRRFGPFRQRRGGCLHRAVDILGAAERHLCDDPAGRRVIHLTSSLRAARVPAASDQHLDLFVGGRCRFRPCGRHRSLSLPKTNHGSAGRCRRGRLTPILQVLEMHRCRGEQLLVLGVPEIDVRPARNVGDELPEPPMRVMAAKILEPLEKASHRLHYTTRSLTRGTARRPAPMRRASGMSVIVRLVFVSKISHRLFSGTGRKTASQFVGCVERVAGAESSTPRFGAAGASKTPPQPPRLAPIAESHRRPVPQAHGAPSSIDLSFEVPSCRESSEAA